MILVSKMEDSHVYVLVCRNGGKCPVGLKPKNAEKNRIVCYNCRHCEAIPKQDMAGLGKM